METIRLCDLTGYSICDHYYSALEIGEKLSNQEEGEFALIDLSNAQWFTPAFTAPFCVIYNQYKDVLDIDVQLPSSFGIMAYMNQIGFPEGVTDLSKSYKNNLPLCLLNNDTNRSTIETISLELRRLMKSHFCQLSAGRVEGLTYPIYEIADNVDQHSECSWGAVLVQKYPKSDRLDVCIIDDGISIPGSFDKSGIGYQDDYKAIEDAISGVTTRSGEGSRSRGFGLQTTINLICDGLNGSVVICSRDGYYSQSEEGVNTHKIKPIFWDGTAFIARMKVPEPEFRLLDYVQEV